ncbi:MAG: ATP-binding cassette domain-containing protein [Blautia sp.]
MGEVLLEIRDIKKQFDGTEVLEGINLSIERGEFITFLGPSGCGKTTTLRIIAGLETPDGGQVLLEGQDVTSWIPAAGLNTVFRTTHPTNVALMWWPEDP